MRSFFHTSALICLMAFHFSGSKNLPQANEPQKNLITSESSNESKALLMSNGTWKMDQVVNVIGGVYTEYKRGGINTTGVAYENYKVSFRKNGTGTHINEFKTSTASRWRFKNSSQNEIIYSVLFSAGTITNTWEMFCVTPKYMYFTCHLSNTGSGDDVEIIRMINTKYLK